MEVGVDMRLDEEKYPLRRIHNLLKTQLPPATHLSEIQYDSTGLDCLIVLIRHIYLRMHPHYPFPDEHHSAMEARNPILSLAWFDFDRDAKPAWIEVKQNILNLFGPASSDDPKLRFENLCNSDLMWETFWSRDEFKLLRAIMDKPVGELWGMRPQAAERMSTNILQVDPREMPDASFNEYISAFFKPRQAADGSQTINIYARPNIMRVKYTRRKEFTPYPFKAIKNVHVPIAGLEDSQPTKFEDQDKVVYTLLAVVSSSDNGIHLYQPMAPQVLFNTQSPITGGKRWSLEDAEDGVFHLFYSCAGPVEVLDMASEFAVIREWPKGFDEVWKRFDEVNDRFNQARRDGEA